MALLGCSDGSTDQPVEESLIDVQNWVEVSASDDPFWADAGGDEAITCGVRDWATEGQAVEINTSACNYATLTQPSLHEVTAGDTLRLSLWWQTLVSEQAAMGHITVVIEDETIFEEEIPIPADASARDIEIQSPTNIPAGAPIYFHVHNHGSNSWSLGSLTVEH